MAQGTVKISNAAKPASKPSGKTKKGARVFKAKKASNADRITKKYTAGLTGKTEKLLGERAGHLEMIGKGRSKDKSKDGALKKGGSRKFG